MAHLAGVRLRRCSNSAMALERTALAVKAGRKGLGRSMPESYAPASDNEPSMMA